MTLAGFVGVMTERHVSQLSRAFLRKKEVFGPYDGGAWRVEARNGWLQQRRF